MLKKILVGELVDEGQRVIDELRRRRLQVRAAFWVELPDTDYWRFVVALPYVNRNGTFETYKVLREALEAIQPEVLSLEDIYVVSPHGDDFKAYLAAAGGPGRLGMGAASGRPPRVVFEDSYVYSVD